ncbi:transposase [Halomarina pelagica]|uniref:transposase n=1 Tax=Halomarina pelagica TaxID=2961599 RepID=UPI0020C3D1BB|nr:transposase [Halomarina sp. BND7]
MVSTRLSRREVFRTIAMTSYHKWPAYDLTPLYDRSSLSVLEEDVRTVAKVWFEHDAHTSVERFVSDLPLAYVEFQPHDRYTGSTRYNMILLMRLFLLKELHGWNHETALVEYLQQRPSLCHRLNIEAIPDQSTLWRCWRYRFTTDLKDMIKTTAKTILIKADRAGVTIPREPSDTQTRHESDEEPTLDGRTVFDQVQKITEHIGQIVYPGFSLDRGEGCEIHEHAFWDLQTYLGLRESLAANEGARSFVYESQRDRTPLGHTHREHVRNLSVDRIHEMYRQSLDRLLERVADTKEFHRGGIVVIDITEANPFTGDRSGYENEIIGTKEASDEYAYQWATAQLVGNAVPLVLDARPVRKGESRLEIVEDLLDSAEELVFVDNVLMDRDFDSQHVLDAISQRGLTYVVPKRMQTSEKAQAKRLCQQDQNRYLTDRNLHLGSNEWHNTTLIYRRKEDAKYTDHRQYSVFMSNGGERYLSEYAYRWEIESGYRSIKRFMAATTSKNFVLRFFYFAFACLLYSIWRAVDLLVQVELTGEYERSPVVTANTVLTLLKQIGIG